MVYIFKCQGESECTKKEGKIDFKYKLSLFPKSSCCGKGTQKIIFRSSVQPTDLSVGKKNYTTRKPFKRFMDFLYIYPTVKNRGLHLKN
jgi:hypothetical protein